MWACLECGSPYNHNDEMIEDEGLPTCENCGSRACGPNQGAALHDEGDLVERDGETIGHVTTVCRSGALVVRVYEPELEGQSPPCNCLIVPASEARR